MSDDNRHFLDTPLGSLITGIAILAVAYYAHSTFTELETGVVDSVRINWIVGIAYEKLGHWPTVGILGMLGAWTSLRGAKRLLNRV